MSDAPGGLPYRWAIKATMWVAYFVLLVAAVSRLSRAAVGIFGGAPKIPNSQG